MPPLIVNLSATTELEAVNSMLAAVGEQPLAPDTNLSEATQADVGMALNILRNVTREVQAMGWKFNTEFGYEVKPETTIDWIDTAGITTVLNIFLPPAGMSGFSVTPIPDQQGSRNVDTEIRPSRQYTVEVPNPTFDEEDEESEPTIEVSALVFYDRQHARDGFKASEHPFLYINPIWLFDFEQIPEVARRYIVAKAAREFVESTVGSDTLSDFVKRSESIGLRNLKREQGENDSFNWLGNVDGQLARGGRWAGPSGMLDPRKNRGHA